MLKKRAQYRIGIDMGERHLFAIVCDRPGTPPVLVPNTLTAETMRGFAAKGSQREVVLASVRRHIHTRCSYLIGLCAEWGVKSIAVGNRAIKNPFKVTYGSLTENPLLNLDIQILSALRFECALSHIDVEIVDEAFTTQKDALALEAAARTLRPGKAVQGQHGPPRADVPLPERRDPRPGHQRRHQHRPSSSATISPAPSSGQTLEKTHPRHVPRRGADDRPVPPRPPRGWTETDLLFPDRRSWRCPRLLSIN